MAARVTLETVMFESVMFHTIMLQTVQRLARLARLALTAACLALTAACSVPVTGGLDDAEANRVVVALSRAGVDSTKEVDPGAEGRWRVDVARDDLAAALSTLRDEELPHSPPRGVLDAVGKGSLVPSEAAEQAQLAAGMAGDLERSLEGIDGVLRARVHLNVPPVNPLRDLPSLSRGSASVLLEHRGSTPPLSADAVQRLVAGGVAGLSPADVAVVMVSRPSPPATTASDLGHIGPIAVARASMQKLQAALIALVAVVALLAAATLVLYARLTRLRAGAALAERAPEGGREKAGWPSS
jgi:type III secretion protein J